MAEAGVEDAALVADMAAARLEHFATVKRQSIRRYGKIPAYCEITFRLSPPRDSVAVLDTLIALIALTDGGWTQGGTAEDRWAVWCGAPGREFLSPSVRWAELQLAVQSIDQ